VESDHWTSCQKFKIFIFAEHISPQISAAQVLRVYQGLCHNLQSCAAYLCLP